MCHFKLVCKHQIFVQKKLSEVYFWKLRIPFPSSVLGKLSMRNFNLVIEEHLE